MFNGKTLLAAVLALLPVSGCLSDSKKDLQVSPQNIFTDVNYPFNQKAPETIADNSLGFYSNGMMYIQDITKYTNIFLSHQLSFAHLYYFEPADARSKDSGQVGFASASIRDTVEIAAVVMPYPAQFDGILDEYERYFKSIRFLIPKKGVDPDGTVYLSGDQIVLKDQKGTAYQTESGVLTFENALSESYNQGGFTVMYKDGNGKEKKLMGGRFKLIRRTESVESAKAFFALDPKGVK